MGVQSLAASFAMILQVKHSCSVSAPSFRTHLWAETLIDEDNYGDTVLINAKSVQEATKLEQAPLSKEEIKREFSCGDISKVE